MKKTVTLAAMAACMLGAPLLAQNNPTVKPSAVKPVPAAKPVEAQPEKKAPVAPAGTDAEMAAWMAAAEPSEHHQHLANMAGEWDCTVKSNWTGQPEQSKATVKAHMRMGGRYLVSNFQGTMMGQPLNGQGIMGYNNMSKKYETVWRDNMGTGMMIETGTCDSAGKVITTSGESAGPDGKMMKSRTVYTIGDKKYSIEMYQPGPDGKETKVFEMHAVQTKPPTKGGAGPDSDMDDAQEQVKKKVKDATDTTKPK
jgi:hypothetical protein